jgi:hypothetical protein
MSRLVGSTLLPGDGRSSHFGTGAGRARFAHGTAASPAFRGVRYMLATIAVILLVLWLLGLFAFKVTAVFIHILLVLAVIAIILHFVRGRGAA